MSPIVIHIVISLEPGGLERMVVSLTNARNKLYPGSTYICCLDKPGTLAADVEGEFVFSLNAERSRFPWDRTAVQSLKTRAGKLLSSLSTTNHEPRNTNMRMVCHSHNLAAWQYAVLSARGSRMQVVYTQHGPNPYNWGVKDRIRCGYLARKTASITAVSKHTANTMAEKQGIPCERLDVIHNGILNNSTTQELENKLKFREKLSIPAESFLIGSVGRFSPEKNYSLLVRAFKEFVEKISTLQSCSSSRSCQNTPTPYLLLVGDGSERPLIEKTIEECGISDNVFLPGMQNNVGEWLSTMDVFCLSSDTEGISLSLLEAQQAGLSAVVTDVGGNAEVITDGVNGIVVPPGDASALEIALARLTVDDLRTPRKRTWSEMPRACARFSSLPRIGPSPMSRRVGLF